MRPGNYSEQAETYDRTRRAEPGGRRGAGAPPGTRGRAGSWPTWRAGPGTTRASWPRRVPGDRGGRRAGHARPSGREGRPPGVVGRRARAAAARRVGRLRDGGRRLAPVRRPRPGVPRDPPRTAGRSARRRGVHRREPVRAVRSRVLRRRLAGGGKPDRPRRDGGHHARRGVLIGVLGDVRLSRCLGRIVVAMHTDAEVLADEAHLRTPRSGTGSARTSALRAWPRSGPTWRAGAWPNAWPRPDGAPRRPATARSSWPGRS